MIDLDQIRLLLEGMGQDEVDTIKRSIAFDPKKDTFGPELVAQIITPTFIGPTWKTNEDGSWYLPEHTLGWEIAGWATRYLQDPRDPSKPFKFTLEQLRWLLWWYAIDSEGKFLYRTGVLQRMKGWGKDPLLAVLCLVEFVGPCRFSHWRSDGTPAGRPEAASHVQVAAYTADQTSNTSSMFPLLMSSDLKKAYGIKGSAASEVIRANYGRQQIQMVSSNWRALEGKRTTFSMMNETHHWQDDDGRRMSEVISDNITKIEGGRWLAITNAFMPGENSVAEAHREDYEKALTDAETDDPLVAFAHGEAVLYDSVEGHPRAPLGGPLAPLVLENIIGDAAWLKSQIPAIIGSARRRSISMSRSRRMWLNQVLADDDALVSKDEWAECMDPNVELMPHDKITLGFDGGRTDDATVLVACRMSDSAVFILGLWENVNDEPGWYVDQAEVNEAVYRAFNMYDVQAFYSDVALWESYIAEWVKDFGEQLVVKASERSPIGFDMRGNQARLTYAHERMLSAIIAGKLKHDGDLKLREHVLNARRNENRWGVSFKKESRESPKKVDAYAAMMLAYEAAYDAQTRGKTLKKQRTGRGYFF